VSWAYLLSADIVVCGKFLTGQRVQTVFAKALAIDLPVRFAPVKGRAADAAADHGG